MYPVKVAAVAAAAVAILKEKREGYNVLNKGWGRGEREREPRK